MLKEVENIEQFKEVMDNCVLVHYLKEHPIAVNAKDIFAVIADNFSENITVTTPLDELICDTFGNFINHFGYACKNPDEFRRKLTSYQLGEIDLPEQVLYVDWYKHYFEFLGEEV